MKSALVHKSTLLYPTVGWRYSLYFLLSYQQKPQNHLDVQLTNLVEFSWESNLSDIKTLLSMTEVLNIQPSEMFIN